MSKAEEAPISSGVGNPSGTAGAKRDSRTHITRLERMAVRGNIALKDALPAGTKARAELDEVTTEILSLQGQATEWGRLHHLVHDVLLALSPFCTALDPLATGHLGSTERQALLQNWRLCQEKMDLLVDFAEDIEHIGQPFHQAGLELLGERWAVETAALRLLLEDALKDDNPSPSALYDLAEDFRTTCHRHLTLANRHLLRTMDQLARLSGSLLGVAT